MKEAWFEYIVRGRKEYKKLLEEECEKKLQIQSVLF